MRRRATHNADLIGLSGLITPSLEEMAHVAREMQREGFTVPLLIGGATTSKMHTAVKIAPAYSGPVVHVADASRAVGVVGALMNPEQSPGYVRQLRADQKAARLEHTSRQTARNTIPLDRARQRRAQIDWAAAEIPRPEFTGVRAMGDVPLQEIVPFIDWSPFFHTWELRGRYPQIFDDPKVGAEARDLFGNAQKLLAQIVEKKLLTARAVYGLWPANSEGDDIEVYSDESRANPDRIFHFLRQQVEQPAGRAQQCLADFVAPNDTGLADHIGGFAVTAGIGIEALVQRFKDDKDDYNAIMAESLADRLAEALAELLHKRVREEWGYGRGEGLSTEELLREKYRGIRPAAGYPACPDHSEKRTLFDLLRAEANTGMRLTENFAMHPGASVSGLYFSHPLARYFAVGKIERDQVLDYHKRKGMGLREVERWLAPNLNYDPEA